jgi:hypothetical protein
LWHAGDVSRADVLIAISHEHPVPMAFRAQSRLHMRPAAQKAKFSQIDSFGHHASRVVLLTSGVFLT